MTKRRIAAHKGGRTAHPPGARIRPQTLQRIRATMRRRDMSFADLLEEEYGGNMDTERVAKKVRKDGEQCSADDVQRLIDSLDADGKQWLKNASAAEAEKWAFDVLINSQPPVQQ